MFTGTDAEEFYETQMVWKTQIKRRFESLRRQGSSSYLANNSQRHDELSEQRAEESRLVSSFRSVETNFVHSVTLC